MSSDASTFAELLELFGGYLVYTMGGSLEAMSAFCAHVDRTCLRNGSGNATALGAGENHAVKTLGVPALEFGTLILQTASMLGLPESVQDEEKGSNCYPRDQHIGPVFRDIVGRRLEQRSDNRQHNQNCPRHDFVPIPTADKIKHNQ